MSGGVNDRMALTEAERIELDHSLVWCGCGHPDCIEGSAHR